ncbi:MAG: hypothetical protein AAGE96_06985 [Cyanobacteria bacterium P01_G01_bin.19]
MSDLGKPSSVRHNLDDKHVIADSRLIVNQNRRNLSLSCRFLMLPEAKRTG